jgi:hypothetical protein
MSEDPRIKSLESDIEQQLAGFRKSVGNKLYFGLVLTRLGINIANTVKDGKIKGKGLSNKTQNVLGKLKELSDTVIDSILFLDAGEE